MHTGVFGGSFDPVHVGHVGVAEAVLEKLSLDRLLVVPTAQHPFKSEGHSASAGDRLAMLKIAFADIDKIWIDGCEFERGGVSYTVDTLRDIRSRFQEDKLSLIVGADTVTSFNEWKDFKLLKEMAEVIVVTRPGEEVHGSERFRVVEVPAFDVSATEIRTRLEKGGSVEGLLAPEVQEFILGRRLYGTGV